MPMTLGEVAALLNAPCEAPQREVLGYSIDSRTLLPGQLFFALRGPRFDGHQFVAQVLERGAAGAVVEQSFRTQATSGLAAALLPVPDTFRALQQLAQAVRRQWGRPLVAVTGSTGKSTVKEMIAAVLGRRREVLKSPGNLNNLYGLPLALLGLEPRHEVAVVELAMSAPGEIARLAQIAQPEVGLVTNVAPVHLEFFDSVNSIARAKRELIDYLSTRGAATTAVLNHDDEWVRRFAEGFPGRVVTFGLGEGAEFRALQVRQGNGLGTEFRVQAPGWQEEFHLRLPGRHNVQNAVAALAVANLLEIPVRDMRQALAEFQNLHQRSEILTLGPEITVINDTYNSNPVAMERLLEMLATWPNARRRIVVAGEMLELGPSSPRLHYEVGRKCAESRVDVLIAVQGEARQFIKGAIEGGLFPENARFFPDARGAAEFCRSILKPGDTILVKGSRGVRLETVVECLTSSPVAASASPPPRSFE